MSNLNLQLEQTLLELKKYDFAQPTVGIILGTGLGGLLNDMKVETEIGYDKIPHFPVSTVESHSGRLLFGTIENVPVVVMQGRFHYYEGYTMQQVVYPVRVMKKLGIKTLLVSNAAGGLNPDFKISDLMVINDHINLQPDNPLIGPNDPKLGPRFPDMSQPYQPNLINIALTAAHQNSIRAHQGVYVAVPGPNLETKAEYRYLRVIGADAVGMSTVPEVLAARHMNIPVFAVSVITDLCTPGNIEPVELPQIIAAAKAAEPGLRTVMKSLITAL